MANNWGVFEVLDDEEITLAIHIVPMVNLDGENVMSAAHVLDPECRCGPLPSTNAHGVQMWNHYDPTHEGAQTDEEFSSGLFKNPEIIQ
jgi:hypothetical protein